MIVGAGCSLELPTGLKLSTTYAVEAHHQLVLNGLLNAGECPNPADLSDVASTFFARYERQTEVVQALPRPRFRMALANEGYLIAAALLREGVVTYMITLNYDMALVDALRALGALEVSIVRGRRGLGDMGTPAVIFLHSNAEEDDLELWVLRREALQEEWQGNWEEVVARRVGASAVVVFAGLGSPAAVLTETIGKVREALPEIVNAFIVDPGDPTAFSEQLGLGEDAHIKEGWCSFMRRVGARCTEEQLRRLTEAGLAQCDTHGWLEEKDHVADLSASLREIGIVGLGKLRARWLLADAPYVPDDSQRSLIADLLLGVGLVARGANAIATVTEDGLVEFDRDGSRTTILFASGSGTRQWLAMEPLVSRALAHHQGGAQPAAVVVAGVDGGPPQAIAPPADVIPRPDDNDILNPAGATPFVWVNDLRTNPDLVGELVA